MSRSHCTVAAAVFLAAFALQAPAWAQEDAARVEIHGFGEWVYGNTSTPDNHYLAGAPQGSYSNAALALNFVANVGGPLKVVAQPEFLDSPEGTEVELDYAFAEWAFSDRLKLRAGKVKQPFGISAETWDVGTLRPFLDLPQAVYGPAGLVGESYKGVGLTGVLEAKHGWAVAYDLYAGGQELEEYAPPEAVLLGEPLEEADETERTNDMLGGRIVLQTPVAGLSFGASGYTGKESGSTRRTGFGVQGEYLNGDWSIRSEYGHETVEDDLRASGFYAEAAYRIGRRWQAAVQYGRFTSDVLPVPDPQPASLLDHEEFAGSLNYWWNRSFVMKLSWHHVVGNRFAGPAFEDLAATVASGSLNDTTNLVAFGAQFTF